METDRPYGNRHKSNARLVANFNANFHHQETSGTRKQSKLAEVSSTLEFRPIQVVQDSWNGKEYLETAGKSYFHNELTLRGKITVKNHSDADFQGIIFKVQTTAPEKFLVAPSVGFVPRKSSIEVEVVTLPEASFRSILNEKFQVLAVQVLPETVLPPRENGKYKSHDLGKLWDQLCRSSCYIETFRLKPVLLTMDPLIESVTRGKPCSGSGDSGRGAGVSRFKCADTATTAKLKYSHGCPSGTVKSRTMASQIECMETVVANLELNSKCNRNYVQQTLGVAVMLVLISMVLLCMVDAKLRKSTLVKEIVQERAFSGDCEAKKVPDLGLSMDTRPWFPLM